MGMGEDKRSVSEVRAKAVLLEKSLSPSASGLEVLKNGRNKFHMSAIKHTVHLRSNKRNGTGGYLY